MVAPETIQLLAVAPAAEVSTIDIPAKIAEAAKNCQRWHIYRGIDGYEQFLTDSKDVGRTAQKSLNREGYPISPNLLYDAMPPRLFSHGLHRRVSVSLSVRPMRAFKIQS